MRFAVGLTVVSLYGAVLAMPANAQPPRGRPPGPGAGNEAGTNLVTRMLAFDKNKNGELTRDEITDERLVRLFEQADANKDGTVTKDELTALAKKMATDEAGPGQRGGPGGGGPGGPGGPGRGGPGGRGPGGFGAPPAPGQVLPPFLQETLKLTDDQKKLVSELQKEVDARLERILTAEQKKQLLQLRQGFGPPGPGGPGRGPGGGQ